MTLTPPTPPRTTLAALFFFATFSLRFAAWGCVQLLRVDAKERELLGQAWSER